MGILWQCRFETGIITEEGFEVRDSTAPVCTSQIVQPGLNGSLYCPRFSVPAVATWTYRRASIWRWMNQATLPLNQFWSRLYIYPTVNNIFFLTYRNVDDAGTLAGRLLFFGIDANGKWTIRLSSNGAGGTTPYTNTDSPASTATAALNQVSLVEVFVNRILGGTAQLYVNGNLVLTWSGIDIQNVGGNFHLILTHEARYNSLVAGYTDIDSVAIGDAQIGPETAVQPKLTVNSSPISGVPVYLTLEGGTEQYIGNTPITVNVPSGTHKVRVEQEITQ